MNKFMRWEGDLPACFGSVLKADGWHITVTRDEDGEQVLEYRGGDSLAALDDVDSNAAARHRSDLDTVHEWVDCTHPDGLERDALVFAGPCGEGLRMRGTLLMTREEFRGSNSRTEEDLLGFIGYLVRLAANAMIANTQSQLLREVGETFSIQLVIFDRMGEIVFESSKGMNFLRDALGVKSRDFGIIRGKLAKLVGHLEKSHAMDRSQVFELQASHASEEDREDTPRYKLIKLHVDEDDAFLPGPYFAIVETRQPEMPDPNTLRRQFELTPAEARVVTRLIEGAPIPDISVDLRLSNHTVRTYLKRSYGKIGVNGQAQLITKITRLSESIGTMPKAVVA